MARRAARVKLDLREGALASSKILAPEESLAAVCGAVFAGRRPLVLARGTSSRLTGRTPGELGKDSSVRRVGGVLAGRVAPTARRPSKDAIAATSHTKRTYEGASMGGEASGASSCSQLVGDSAALPEAA